MRKGLLFVGVFVIATALSLVIGITLAAADNGVHDKSGFTADVDECAACHRIHTGDAASLLNTTGAQYEFCATCHSGTGAETNVEDGVKVTGGAPLMGGGFVNAIMDTNLDGTLDASTAVTSTHTVATTGSETSAILWGNGAIDSGVGTSITLTCGACHDPHGNGNYRILRDSPTGGDGTFTPTLTDEVTPDYVQTYTTTSTGWDGTAAAVTNRDANTFTGVSDWCSQCHTRHNATAAGDSGDAIYAFQHPSDTGVVNCSSCHVAHGSTSSMGSYSDAVTYPDGATGEASISQSGRLLWADNRGVCTQCHAPTEVDPL
jgi:predicted CXXCH cytochrome family protein